VGYALDFGWLGEAAPQLASGAAMTLFLTVAASAIGLTLSILGAAARASRFRLVRLLVSTYVEAIRNTPFLAQLFFIYFGLPSIGVLLNPTASAILALTINVTAYGVVIVGAGLDAVPPGQWEAGRSLGLSDVQLFTRIVLPQAMRIIFPALASQIVITMLDSAVVSQVSVPELTFEGDVLQARTFRAFETYGVVTLIYLGLTIALRRGLAAGQRLISPA
jgi:polar amino acid transport system permease protein